MRYNINAKQNCIFRSINELFLKKGYYTLFAFAYFILEFDKNASSKSRVCMSSCLFYAILFGDKSEFAFFRRGLRLAPFLFKKTLKEK